jgi:hypothetical protein
LIRCAAQSNIDWIVAMGDSQEREFVGMMKNYNGSKQPATKFPSVCTSLKCLNMPHVFRMRYEFQFFQADFRMHGSANNLRIIWQFFEHYFVHSNPSQNPRDFFRHDVLYFDHFNLAVSEVL